MPDSLPSAISDEGFPRVAAGPCPRWVWLTFAAQCSALLASAALLENADSGPAWFWTAGWVGAALVFLSCVALLGVSLLRGFRRG